MILKTLYDYYNRCDGLPDLGMEEKQIGFLVVIDKEGHFLRFEDCRIDKNTAKTFLVKKSVGRSSAPVANYLYDNSAYVLGYSGKDNGKDQLYFDTFKNMIKEIANDFPDNTDIESILKFYNQSQETLLASFESDPLWEDIKKNLSKKYSTFSFRINGDTKIIAEKKELLQLDNTPTEDNNSNICLITGKQGVTVETTTATMIPGSQATAKLVAFQVKSGYDSYGKQKGNNAPISEKAEFAYTTALNTMLARDSHNKFMIGGRTFLFWASSINEACQQAEASVFDLFGFTEKEDDDDPNRNIKKVREVFNAIWSGQIKTTLDDKFYILGLAPNAARIAVVYWSETSLKDFACVILKHFNDMEIVDTRQKQRPYVGLKDMLGAVTLGGKHTDVTPNLPDAVVKSIFQGTSYPYTLFSSAIRRIRAEQDITPYSNPCRVAILKAYLNRINDNNIKIQPMLDKENTNQGYLCGRLFAVLDRIQEKANGIHSIQERYMNAASSTPSAVFATILNLSAHHSEKLDNGAKIVYEKLKQEIISKLSANGFPAHLDLQDQGRFFIGFYHQRQDFFTKKEESVTE